MHKMLLIIKNKEHEKAAANEGFGVRRGVVSWDTSQEFESSPPVRAFAPPRPHAKPPKR